MSSDAVTPADAGLPPPTTQRLRWLLEAVKAQHSNLWPSEANPYTLNHDRLNCTDVDHAGCHLYALVETIAAGLPPPSNPRPMSEAFRRLRGRFPDLHLVVPTFCEAFDALLAALPVDPPPVPRAVAEVFERVSQIAELMRQIADPRPGNEMTPVVLDWSRQLGELVMFPPVPDPTPPPQVSPSMETAEYLNKAEHGATEPCRLLAAIDGELIARSIDGSYLCCGCGRSQSDIAANGHGAAVPDPTPPPHAEFLQGVQALHDYSGIFSSSTNEQGMCSVPAALMDIVAQIASTSGKWLAALPDPTPPLQDDVKAFAVLRSMEEWLSNSDGLMIEDVVEWRDGLVAAFGLSSSRADWQSCRVAVPDPTPPDSMAELRALVRGMRHEAIDRLIADAPRLWPDISAKVFAAVLGAVGEISVVEARTVLQREQGEAALRASGEPKQ